MKTFPQNKIWSQVSGRDVFDPTRFGILMATAGIDLADNIGRLRIGRRLLLNTGEADLADINGVPVGFWLCGSGIYTIAGDGTNGYALVNDGTLIGAFARSTAGTEPTKVNSKTSDGVFGNNKLYISEVDGGQVYLCKKVGDTDWGSRISMEGDVVGYPHMLWFFEGRIYMTNSQSKVISMDSGESVATSGANTLILNGISGDFTNVITRPFVSAGRNWLPCINTMGGKGHVYEWDGASTTYNVRHRLHTAGALTGCDYHDIPYIFDVEGNLLEWNGATFKVVASLYRKKKKLLYNTLSLINDRCVHPNGMQVVEDKIRIVIDTRNNDSTYSVEETMPAGVYEYDPKNPTLGLYCIELFGLTKAADTIIDHGQLRIAAAGGLAYINLPSTSATRNGQMMVGAKVYTSATVSKHGIWYDDLNDTKQKAGTFITLKIDSDSLKDIMSFLHLLYSKFKTSTDKFVMKYLYEDDEPVEATITWVNTTSFTVPNSDIDLTTYYTAGNAKSAEVEIIHGVGGNKSAHITNAVLAGGTWTVTVDETYTGATGTAKARFKKWLWLGEANYDQGDTKLNIKPDQSNSWFQFKFWGMWTGGVELERMITDEEDLLPADLKNS